MPRIARKDLGTPFLHVMVQGINQEYIFNSEDYIRNYMNIVNRNIKEYDITIIAYCIMNNHAHFLMYVENINVLGKLMHKCNLIYAQFYNDDNNRTGVLFRNRYQAEPIYNMKYLINCIKYIHENPLNAGMVDKCSEYKFSSYNEYINNGEITKSNIMKEIFGSKCDFSKLFDECCDREFMDVKNTNKKDKHYYITEGIRMYMKEKSINIVEILSDRKIFKSFIFFLNEVWGVKYVEIAKFFDINRGSLNGLLRR